MIKLKFNKDNDESSCILHHCSSYTEKLPLRYFTEKSLARVKEACDVRNDDKVGKILKENDVMSLPFHQKCYDVYTHCKALDKIRKNKEDTERNEAEIIPPQHSSDTERRKSCRKRDRMGKTIADKECCICSKKKWKDTSYESLTKCVTQSAAETLKLCAVQRFDTPRLQATIASLEWDAILAQEIYYHRSCYLDFTRPNVLTGGLIALKDDCTNRFLSVVKKRVIDDFEVLPATELTTIYSKISSDSNVPTRRTLVGIVKKEFAEKVATWVPKFGPQFVFNNEVDKGHIIEVLLKQINELKKQIDDQTLHKDKIKEVGTMVRTDVKKMQQVLPWPPTESQLISARVNIPQLLENLLTNMLSSTPNMPSERIKRRINSIGQDIIYAISNGELKTKKHVQLAFCIKRKTGAKEVLKWLNRLGHGISYDEVNFLETHLADQAVNDQRNKSYCPSSITPSKFVTFVWDNNDVNPDSINGQVMHCTNGIIVQLSQINDVATPTENISTTRVLRKRSFKPVPTSLPNYIQHKRENPVHLNNLEVLTVEGDIMMGSAMIDFLWVVFRKLDQKTLNWTGFNYQITNEDPSSHIHHVAYLPAIDASPTKMDVVLELLTQSKEKAIKLGLKETDLVLDQAIYAKALEILLNPAYHDLKQFFVLRLGAFHTSMTFLAVIGKRFADAGLRDLILESGLIGESSVERVLAGKHYNRAIRIYQYLYDAITRLRIESFEEHLDGSEYQDFVSSDEFQICLTEMNEENIAKLLESNIQFLTLVVRHIDILKDVDTSGPTSCFWFSFIEMLDILFCFQRSLKIGDWEMHLEATRRMLPYFFAYDHQNYSRFLTLYWAEMRALPNTHPDVYEQFKDGNFAVKRTEGKYNKVPTDQCIEQTVNRQQKCKGGISGFSASPSTVQRWVLTSHVASKCFASLETEIGIKKSKKIPKDFGKSRASFNNTCVKNAYNVLSNWGSPFTYRESLVNIASGREADVEVQNDLLGAQQIGENAFTNFFNDRIKSSTIPFYDPIKKNNLKTFKELAVKKNIITKEKTVTLKAERNLFGRLLVIAKSRKGLSLKEIFTFSLSPIPWCFGLPDGGLVKTVKSKLLDAIEANANLDSDTIVPQEASHIYDGMVLIQQLNTSSLQTFADVSKKLLERIMVHPTVYFVTDRYLPHSIKSFERSRRGNAGRLRIRIQRREQAIPKQWSKYLKDESNKTELTKFLFEDWSHESLFSSILQGKTLFVNSESSFYKITCSEEKVKCEKVNELENYQEEADTKVFLCAQHSRSPTCIHTVDSDIAIYSLYFCNEISSPMYISIGIKEHKRIINVTALFEKLGEKCCKALPALHAFTGNDYTSAFHSIGKVKAFQILKTNSDFCDTFAKFGDNFIFDSKLFSSIEKFVCKLYGLKCNDTDEARYLKFVQSERCPEPQKFPPTRDALLCHCKRVSFVTAVVKRALDPLCVTPQVDVYHGWVREKDDIRIQWMVRNPAPDEVMQLISCNCKKLKCETRACLCQSHGLSCTDLCGCNSNCANLNEVSSDSESDSSEDDEEVDNNR